MVTKDAQIQYLRDQLNLYKQKYNDLQQVYQKTVKILLKITHKRDSLDSQKVEVPKDSANNTHGEIEIQQTFQIFPSTKPLNDKTKIK